jgi:Tfp pilus assembly protein PilX
MTSKRQQRGATLMVTLIMLVVLTLFALTAFNLSSVNLRIVGNFQEQKFAESLVQQALEQAMSTVSIFSAPAAACLPNNSAPQPAACIDNCTSCANTADVLVHKPRCNYTAPAKGYTKKIGELTPEDTNWEVRASYTDSLSKASVVIVQGVGVRMLAGNCPSS